jgi:hypothetical protein
MERLFQKCEMKSTKKRRSSTIRFNEEDDSNSSTRDSNSPLIVSSTICPSLSPLRPSLSPLSPLSPPHIRNNIYLINGYIIHSTINEAIFDNLFLQRISNETVNIFSGMLLFIPAIYIFIASFSPKLLLPIYGSSLRQIALIMFFNTICVVSYHTLLSIPSLYTLMSAIDFVAVTLLQLAIVSAAYYIPGVSLWGAHFSSPSVNKEVNTSSKVVDLFFGLLFKLSPQDALYTHFFVIFVSAIIVFATRIYIDKELPKSLVFLNILWYLVLIPDLLLASPESIELKAMCISLILGGFFYITKIPERFLKGKFNLYLHSHVLWHLCYVFAFSFFVEYVVKKAFQVK